MKAAPQVGLIMGRESDGEAMPSAVTSWTESGPPPEAGGIPARGHRFAMSDTPS